MWFGGVNRKEEWYYAKIGPTAWLTYLKEIKFDFAFTYKSKIVCLLLERKRILNTGFDSKILV